MHRVPNLSSYYPIIYFRVSDTITNTLVKSINDGTWINRQ